MRARVVANAGTNAIRADADPTAAKRHLLFGGRYAPAVHRLTQRRATWLLIGCAVVSTIAVAWPPDRYDYRAGQRRVYGSETWWLLVLLWAGTLAVAAAPVVYRGAGAALATVSALQLAGTGVVAHRRWFTSGGFGGHATNETTLRGLAIVLTVVAVAAVAACVAVLVDAGAFAVPRRARKVVPVIVIGVAVAVVVPLAMGWERFNRTTQGGAHALMYGVPWGLAICGSAYLRYRERIATVVALALSAISLVVWEPMIPGDRVRLGAVVLGVALLLTMPMRGQAPTVASRRSSGRSGVGRAKA
jgi:hypothetical protein